MDRHPIDTSWPATYRALLPLMRVDNRANIPYIVREYVGLALTIAACSVILARWREGVLPTLAFLPLSALGIAVVAAFQHRLSGLAHDASHYTLFRNKLANELISDLLLMFPIVAMTQKYRAAHLGHHQYVNDPERDPDLLRLNHPTPQVFPVSKREFWRRYVAQALWPPSILGYLLGRARAANLEAAGQRPLRAVYRTRVARSLRGAYWLSVLSAVHLLGAWPIFWLYWVVPLLTMYPLFMQLREIAHHCNAPDDGDLTNSRVFEVHPLLNACVFPYGQAFHLTHHLVAMVPHYHAAEAHQILLGYPPYRESAVVCRGYFFAKPGTSGPTVLDVLSALVHGTTVAYLLLVPPENQDEEPGMSNGTTNQIKEHMEVVCSKGGKVGTVDHVEGDKIKLTKNDSPDGMHHTIPTSIVGSVDTKVHLTVTGDQVHRMWQPA